MDSERIRRLLDVDSLNCFDRFVIRQPIPPLDSVANNIWWWLGVQYGRSGIKIDFSVLVHIIPPRQSAKVFWLFTLYDSNNHRVEKDAHIRLFKLTWDVP